MTRRCLLSMLVLSACQGSAMSAGGEKDAADLDATFRDDANDDAAGDAFVFPDASSCLGSCIGKGESCFRESSVCACDATKDEWVCRACLATWSESSCPPSMICAEGTPCASSLLGMGCAYPDGCGGVDRLVCLTAGWFVDFGYCPAGCPNEEPIPGSPCATDRSRCPAASACGSILELQCIEDRWAVFDESLPCPTIECIESPVTGAACDRVNTQCEIANSCGGKDVATCFSGHWRMETGACCPSTLPTEGAACGSPSKTPCRYEDSKIDCYCEPDNTFHCMKRPSVCDGGADCTAGYSCKPAKGTFCTCQKGKLVCERRPYQ